MNVNVPAQDSRNIEVPCPGFAVPRRECSWLWTSHCAMPSCDGQAHPPAADHDGAVLLQARGTRRRRIWNLRLQAAASSLFSRLRLAEDGARRPCRQLRYWQTPMHETPRLTCSSQWFSCGKEGGRECWPWLALCPLPRPFLNPCGIRPGVATDGETPLLAALFECDPRVGCCTVWDVTD